MSGRKKLFELFIRSGEEWVFVADLEANTKSDALLLALMALAKEHTHLELRVVEKSVGHNSNGKLN